MTATYVVGTGVIMGCGLCSPTASVTGYMSSCTIGALTAETGGT